LWFPRRIGLASALYTNGIIFGEALGAGLTLPVLALIGPDAWRLTVALWGVPVLVVLIVWLAIAPEGRPPPATAKRGRSDGLTAAQSPASGGRIAGRPFWLLGLHLGLLSGCCSLIYFNMNAWTAPYNAAVGNTAVTPLSLTLLNASQLPVCLTLTPFAQRLTGRRLPFALSGLFCLAAIAGWTWTPSVLQPVWAALFGGSTVAVLVLGLALPPYFATPATVARLVGATLTVSYLLSFSGQVLGGRLWDLSGRPIFAFAPVPVAALALIVLATLLPTRRRVAASESRMPLLAEGPAG
ncbi:MAG TPA: MFS transporter, partial [Bryobacteraceae bacterium]|nr:MFS transporter [Bryobacteraceae bacterium]